MNIEISEILPFFSLVVAFLAFLHSVYSAKSNSKQIQKLVNEHLQLSSNVALNKASQKYVARLSDVNNKFEDIVSKLSYPALEASRNFGYVFDKFDTQDLSTPHLRHAFHESICIVREAYEKELTYQTGLNLRDRISFLKFIKDDVALYERNKTNKSIFSFLRPQKSPETPEEIINSSTVFWNNVKILYERVPSQNVPELFKEALEHMEEYFKLHRENRKILEDLERKLEESIKENSLELYDIREIPSLGQKFYRVKGDIGRFKELYCPDFHGLETVPIVDGIAYSIYAGSILYIASQHFMWGKI